MQTRVATSMVHDDRLNYDTLGMLLRLLSLPDDTVITFDVILTGSNAGRDKCYRMIREAQEFGYVKAYQPRKVTARMAQPIYLVSDDPSAIVVPVQVRASDFYKRKSISFATRREVYARDGYACCDCGAKWQLSLDHIIAVSSGGDNSLENLRTLCLPCNLAKGALNEGEF